MATVSSVDKIVSELGNTVAGKFSTKPRRKPEIKRAPSVLIDSNSAPVTTPAVAADNAIEIDPASIYIDPSINQRIHSTEIRKRDKAFQNLKVSLQENGQIQPIMVRPSTRPDYTYELVYGSRRLHACMAVGLNVNAIVKPMSDEDALATAYIENEERDDYWPIEDARALMCFLNNENSKTPKYRIKKYENCDRTTKHRLKDFASLPDALLECCNNPAALTERNTRSFRSFYRKNKATVDKHIKSILKGATRHSPAALMSILMDDAPLKRRKAVQYKDSGNNVVVSIHGVKNTDGRLSQSVTLYNSDVESLDELIQTLTMIKKRIDRSSK